MKKLFVAVALVMGIGTSVFAYNMNPASIETVTTVNDFTPIEVKRSSGSCPRSHYQKLCRLNYQRSFS